MSRSTEPGDPTEPEVASQQVDADPHAPTVGAAGEDDAQTVPPTWWDETRDRPRPASNPFRLTEVSPQRYEILGEHGRGGLGRVLRARDRRTGRVVALKEGLRDTPHAMRRFEREALVTANLQHPTIVPVYEVGCWPDGHPFYAMKLVEGMTLSAAIRAAAAAADRLALLPHVVHVADGLAYAHARGWIHRDLKPGNVLVGAFGETVVIDWGLAKRVDDGTDESSDTSLPLTPDGATLDGQILGTPAYMAPEQARGERVDARSDVYAIGALLYQVLAGVPPYHEGGDSAAVLALVIAGPPRPLAELAPDLPTELYTIVARAMAYRAADRYPSARELADDLGRFGAGNLVSAHVYSSWHLMRRWVRRHRTAVAVAALAAITLAVVGVVSYRENSRARRRAEAEGARALAAGVESDARRRDAEARVVALHAELGLRELSAGSPARALPYLADAYRKAPDDPVVGFLVSRGLASLTPLEMAFDTDVVYALGFGGGRLVPSTSGRTPVVDLDSRRTLVEITSGAGVISPDGRVLATRIDDHTIAIHDATSGTEQARRTVDADGEVQWMAFDGAGRILATSAAGVVHVLQADLTPVTTARIPFAPVDVVVTAAGRVLAGGSGGELWSWEVASGRASPLPRVHGTRVGALCASPDGHRWLSIDRAEIVVWNDSRVVARAPHTGRPAGCAVDAAGRRAVTSVDGHGVDLWDLAAATPSSVSLRDGHGAPPNYSDIVALSANGARVAIADSRGHVEVITAADRRVLAHFVGHDAPIATAGFAPDGARLVTATVAGDVRVWRASAASDVIPIDLGDRGSAAAFLDDARVVAVGTRGARVVATSDGRTLAELQGHTDAVSHVDVDRRRGHILTASRDGTARLWRDDGTVVTTLAGGGGWVRRVGFSANGAQILTAAQEGGLALWRADGSLDRRVPVPAPLFAARMAPDGRRAMATREGGTDITLVDTERGTVVASLSPMGQQAVDARWSPDGDLLAIPTVTMLLPVFDGRTGERRFEVEHEAPVLAAAWSDDGATLVSTDLAGVIRVSGRDGTRLRTLKTTTGIAALALHPRGHLVAVSTQDAVVHILELSTGRELASLAIRDFPVVLAFSPSGDHLAIAGNDDVVRLWSLAPYRGAADALDRRLRCAVPFRLDDTHGLAAAEIDPGAC